MASVSMPGDASMNARNCSGNGVIYLRKGLAKKMLEEKHVRALCRPPNAWDLVLSRPDRETRVIPDYLLELHQATVIPV